MSDGTLGPLIPRRTAVAWRLGLLADRRRINAYLRLFGAAGLPLVSGGRLAAMDLPLETTMEALRKVRAIESWDLAWTWAARRDGGGSPPNRSRGLAVRSFSSSNSSGVSLLLWGGISSVHLLFSSFPAPLSPFAL